MFCVDFAFGNLPIVPARRRKAWPFRKQQALIEVIPASAQAGNLFKKDCSDEHGKAGFLLHKNMQQTESRYFTGKQKKPNNKIFLQFGIFFILNISAGFVNSEFPAKRFLESLCCYRLNTFKYFFGVFFGGCFGLAL